MKHRIKIIVLILALFLLVMFLPRDCCVCDAGFFHEPCLVDGKTGQVLPLTLYAPHPTLVAELSENPLLPESFSFRSCGKAEGIRDTGVPVIQMEIPRREISLFPKLCRRCRKQLPTLFLGRYIIADLHDRTGPVLYDACRETDFLLRTYHITVTKSPQVVNLSVEGILK